MKEQPVVLDIWRHSVDTSPDWRLLLSDTRHVEFWLALRRVRRGSRVLDFGSGSGLESLWLEHKFAFQVIGVDLSADLVNLARENAARVHSKSAFVVADGRALPFSNNEFDAAFSTDV
jgi:ubiquinone/menaquinone biosynthesis C-methylase UbiE